MVSASRCLIWAGKIQEAKAGFEDVAHAGGHQSPVGGYGADCGFVILTHEAAVAFYVGAEDGAKFSSKTFCAQGLHLEVLKVMGMDKVWINGV